jgi:tRNA-dihydrouridine synthase A
VLNGGLANLPADIHHLTTLDGLMYGREAYHNPWMLQAVDPLFAGTSAPVTTRAEAVAEMRAYLEHMLRSGGTPHKLTRHMLGLYHGQPGGRMWRQVLSTRANLPGADATVLDEALHAVETRAARRVAA